MASGHHYASEATTALAFLRPSSIALIGASDRSRWSQTAWSNLTTGGFPGSVYLVNPRGGLVHGHPAARSCGEIDARIDLALILAPAQASVDALREFSASGGRSAVILASGFAETGAAGRQAQQAVAEAARSLGIRLLGPNSLGFVNLANHTAVWATPLRAPSRRHGVAIVSQSGATALFLANLAYQQDVGLSAIVATGNEADLDSSTFSQALLDDPSTRALALFIETVRDPASFRNMLEAALLARKPVVVIKVGASEATARSAIAHTGALVGDDRVFDGLCRQYGVIRVHAIEDLLTTADIAARTGLLQPGGLAIVSNSGGVCEIAADAAARHGVGLPEIDAGTVEAMRDAIPGFATPGNPLDLTGAITPEQCRTVTSLMAAQPGIAAMLCPYYEVPVTEADQSERLTALHQALAESLHASPVPGFVVSYTSTHLSALARRLVAENGLPYLACGLDRAITGLTGVLAWSKHVEQLSSRTGGTPEDSHVDDARPRSEHETLRWLAGYGVPVVPVRLAATEDEAVAAAADLGPERTIVKIASPDIAHKSDVGGIALDLHGESAVRSAFGRVLASARAHMPTARIEGVLVAPMRPRGVELFVGISRDVQWGLVLVVGLGGIWVEVLGDVALRLLPVEPVEIRRMLEGLRGAALLKGYRGAPAANLDRAAQAIMRICEAALAVGPDLVALDVNPLWVNGDMVEALDALCVWQAPAEPYHVSNPRHDTQP